MKALRKSDTLWKNTILSAQLGAKLLGELLYLSLNTKKINEEKKLKILFNLGAARRFISAYLYYLEPLKKQIASDRKDLLQIIERNKKFIKILKNIEKKLENSKSNPSKLTRNLPLHAPIQPIPPGTLEPKKLELLLESSAAMARGIDIVTFYLLNQYQKMASRRKYKIDQNLEFALTNLNENLKKYRKSLKNIVRIFPKEDWAKASLYHSALALVSLKYLYRSMKFPAKREESLKKFRRYFRTLRESVSRINPVLSSFWKE